MGVLQRYLNPLRLESRLIPGSLKPFWPLLLTFVLPRAYGYVRAFQVAYRTRPQPQPLPRQTALSLVLLSAVTVVFFITSLSTFATDQINIFLATNSRLAAPSDSLFHRLANLRPGQVLTPLDEELRQILTGPTIRKLYLRFGPTTIAKCSFCDPLDPSTYLLYHFPRNIVYPHLLNFGILGLATSATVAGIEASIWRFRVLIGALALAALDAYYVVTWNPNINTDMPGPAGLFWAMAALRPFCLCLFDATVAAIIYLSATKRFLLFAMAPKDPKITQQQTTELMNKSIMAMATTATKIRGTNLARNVVFRNADLKHSEDQYWKDVVEHEGPQDLRSGAFEDEDVQAALARAYGSGTVNIERIRKEADGFVKCVTQSMDNRIQ